MVPEPVVEKKKPPPPPKEELIGEPLEVFVPKVRRETRESESVKFRFSKCRFSAELEKLDRIFEMGGSVEKQIQKALGQHFHSVAVQE